MSAASQAVFLSYASQDADAARRIADALRGAGVEVWFDQNELRGGDAWEAKIRRQIKECALFVPVISANTNARLEGYFRREWRLAVDRTHDMAEEKAFLVPVVIDATTDANASVPEKFREMQWTRLVMTETPAAFAERVHSLLTGEKEPRRPRPGQRGPFGELRVPSLSRDEGAAPPRRSVASFRWAKVVLIAAVAVGLIYALRPLWTPSRPPAPVPGTRSLKETEARQKVTQARALYERWDFATHNDFNLAEQLLKRAIELDPSDAEAWERGQRVSPRMVNFPANRIRIAAKPALLHA